LTALPRESSSAWTAFCPASKLRIVEIRSTISLTEFTLDPSRNPMFDPPRIRALLEPGRCQVVSELVQSLRVERGERELRDVPPSTENRPSGAIAALPSPIVIGRPLSSSTGSASAVTSWPLASIANVPLRV